MIISESWGENRHTARCTDPYPSSCSVNWCLAEAEEMEISAAHPWTLWFGKDFKLRYLLYDVCAGNE